MLCWKKIQPALAASMLLVALSWPMATMAQPAAGESSAPMSTKYQQAQAFDAYSACVVARSPEAAAGFALEAGYMGDELRGRMKALMPALRACLQKERQGMLRISPYLLRGEMARALWLKKAPAPRAYLPPTAADAAGPNGALAQEEQLSAAFAACLVAAEPAASADFVRALAGSREEQVAFGPMKLSAEGCTLEGSRDIVLGGDRLRAALAIALFGGTATKGAN